MRFARVSPVLVPPGQGRVQKRPAVVMDAMNVLDAMDAMNVMDTMDAMDAKGVQGRTGAPW